MPTRGCLTINLKGKKDEILGLLQQGATYDNIVSQVGTTKRILRQQLIE
jgi:hypothetical protein